MLDGLTTAAITAAEASDSRIIPVGYRNELSELVRQTSSRITISPTSPTASSSAGLRTDLRNASLDIRVGHTIASAAPTSNPNARVSVPS